MSTQSVCRLLFITFFILATWPKHVAIEPTAVQKLLAADGAVDDSFGYSVSVSGDTAVIGAVSDDEAGTDSGSAYVFTRVDGVWSQEAKLVADDGADGDHFGYSVSVSGNTAVIGSIGDDDAGSGSGSAYVFIRSDDVWSQEAKFVADDGAASDAFGCGVSVFGNTAVIGACFDDDADVGADSGSAYVFIRLDGSWSQEAKLVADDGASGDWFGRSVSVDGDAVLIGAVGDDDGGSWAGSAYVFIRSNGAWSQEAKLLADDGAYDDWFGGRVSMSGDTALIGVGRDDDAGSGSGSAYVFTRSGGGWNQEAKLVVADGAGGDHFGSSVSLSGDMAVIGAAQDDNTRVDSGSAYVFIRSGGSWSQKEKLVVDDGATADMFGWSVFLSGDTILIGAYRDDDAASGSGSAYVFSKLGGIVCANDAGKVRAVRKPPLQRQGDPVATPRCARR